MSFNPPCLLVRENFITRFYHHLRTTGNQREAYELTEQECEAHCGQCKYSDFYSFKTVLYRTLKKGKKK